MLRYCESKKSKRDEKVLECLSTMGSAVVLGAFSTILGVMPLAFSSSQIFFSLFVVFLSFVALSLAHGILYLPVLLALIGPQAGHGIKEQQNIAFVQTESPRDRKGTDETAEISINIEGDDRFCDLVLHHNTI